MNRVGLKIIVSLVIVLMLSSVCFSADTKTVDIRASIPQQNGLTVDISRVVGDVWTPATSVDFGSLVFDSDNNIFTAEAYYALDVGINSNSVDWTVAHTVSPITNGTENLDNNINVVFMRQESDTVGTEFAKFTYANSNNRAFTKLQLSGAWLRIYYGVATGDPAEDAPGAEPVPSTKTFGDYRGTITLTLTP